MSEPGPYRLTKVINDSMGTYRAEVAVEVCPECGSVWVPVGHVDHCPNYFREDHQ